MEAPLTYGESRDLMGMAAANIAIAIYHTLLAADGKNCLCSIAIVFVCGGIVDVADDFALKNSYAK